jgi:hypothetical protein
MTEDPGSRGRRDEQRPPPAPGSAAAARRVVLAIDNFAGPPLGGGCCGGITREDAVIDELDSWSGLLTLDVDVDAGTATVLVQPACPDLEHALAAIADRGMSATVVSDDRLR